MTTVEELNQLIQSNENEHIEFKTANRQFEFDKLKKYVVAIANEGGGRIIFGVHHETPRHVVGTEAFQDVESIKYRLLQSVRLRIDVEEVKHPDGRVLIFHVPSRPIGLPLEVDGQYFMRSGESLVPMTVDMLQRIFAESGPDYTAETCAGATIDDLDPIAVNVFRERWSSKSKNEGLKEVSVERLLEDAELTVNGQVTIAALVLLGSSKALGRHLANSEVIFEYRVTEDQIASSQRIEYRQGFLAIHDDLWTQVNLRNDVVSIREGLFRRDIPAFNEDVVREAILNAVCHRDYRLGGSVFIHQYPYILRITSPGGLPDGVTPKNILNRQSPRNRRLAEACSKCGLVERSGQGMDRIFGTLLREGKSVPEFSGTDPYQVVLTVRADHIDHRFLGLLEIADRHDIRLNVDHLVVLDAVRQDHEISDEMKPLVKHLIDIGLLERRGRGRASKVMLSRGMYRVLGEPGIHTRVEGLDRETNKALLLKHAVKSGKAGANLDEFRQVLPSLSNDQVRHMVYELRDEGKLTNIGQGRGTRWYAEVDK